MLALLAGWATGCGEPAPEPHLALPLTAPTLDQLRGRIVSDNLLELVADRGWTRLETETDEELWQVDGPASLTFHIPIQPGHGPDSPGPPQLAIRIAPGPDGLPDLRARWNGIPLEQKSTPEGHALFRVGPKDSENRADEATASTAAEKTAQDENAQDEKARLAGEGVQEEYRAGISPPLLEGPPIWGVLQIDPPAGTRLGPLVANAPGWSGWLRKSNYQRQQYLHELFTTGVGGSASMEKLGGFVFAGAVNHSLALAAKGGELRFRAQPSCEQGATFEIRGRGLHRSWTLAGHQREDLRLEIPPGEEELMLSVDGPSYCLFLWGAPYFRPAGDSGRGQDRDSSSQIVSGSPSPTVILLTLDTTRRDALGAYGPASPGTPHLDALAQRSTVFEHAWSTAPWTLPSHASMLTGLYPSRHGAGVLGPSLPNRARSVAEYLGQAGYLRGGFVGGPLAAHDRGLAQGFDIFTSPETFERSAKDLTDRAIAFTDWAGDAPFFLFVNYFDPHMPFTPPADLLAESDIPRRIQGISGPWRKILDGDALAYGRLTHDPPKAPPRPTAGDAGRSPEALQHEAAKRLLGRLYALEVFEMDRQIGRLLQALEARGRLDEALIVVLADHGELLGEEDRYSHSFRLERELVAIPFLIKEQGQIQGRREEVPVSAVDVFATLLQGAGVPAAPSDGVSLLGLASPSGNPSGYPPQRRPWVLAEEHELLGIHSLGGPRRLAERIFGVRNRSSRMLFWQDSERCFRAKPGRAWRDPWQEVDCGGTDLGGDELARARAQVDALHRDRSLAAQAFGIHSGAAMAPSHLDEEEKARLRALGYIQ